VIERLGGVGQHSTDETDATLTDADLAEGDLRDLPRARDELALLLPYLA
jgi:hypothetical protein